jgi:chromosome segregation ATPase
MKLGHRKDPPEQLDSGDIDRADSGESGQGLEERLRALIDLERATRDSFEQRAAEQLAARRAETNERIAAVEEALTEVQIREEQERVAKRSLAELEKNLVEAWSEVARIREELAEARREAEQARAEIKPRSERKVAEAQTALAEARTEAEQDRELRAELEQRLDALEQSEREAQEKLEQRDLAAEAAEQRVTELEGMLAAAQAEAQREREQRGEVEQRLAEAESRRGEAEHLAGEARESLAREREERDDERKRILAIDEQLQALVEGSEGPGRHVQPEEEEKTPPVEGGINSDEQELEEISEPEPVPPLLEALGTGQPRETTTAEPAELTFEEEDDVPEPSETAQERSAPGRGRRRWGRKSQRQSYICAVCKRLPLGQRPRQLTAAGWVIAGEAALCPDCQGLGWQLPEDGGLPFRRSSAGQTSS